MFRLRRINQKVGVAPERKAVEGNSLPLRWVVIGLLTAGAAAVAFSAGGPVAALMAGAAIASAAHQLID